MNDRAVLYLRLSKEDVDKISEGDDSASIKNQRLLLVEYANKHNMTITNIYSDDDERDGENLSHVNWERCLECFLYLFCVFDEEACGEDVGET